jgi:hypothetical protein
MRKITKVPNGPLIKKKGPFKGSTLKNGGPVKKEQRVIAKDNTRVANNFNVSKLLRQEKDAKRLKSDVKRVTRPYTVIAKPDPEAMFPGDSIRYYTGQRGGVGVPYIRDVAGSKGGLLGINTRTSDAEFAKASRDKKNFRTYQDTTAVKANFEKNKNGGKVTKAKSGAMIKRADGSMSRRGLWDNIRANKGSGKKPTAAMLKQERKIKAKTKK